ncbi:heavy-metal-associated domain-containing protein [Alcaligenaceae bacterium LF4-65]|uniref:Heavy-metal-associated domain-containing protein n=1 Tax=Zwartia hollandica TaxID=324606 RepID=A0A953N8G0_9BURK|nr:heavy-metal-associated domain-containing protein [Zwartia hollandica]
MIKLNVPEMSCNHCVKSITAAILGKYDSANVVCDLSHRTVEVKNGPNASELQAILNEAGYSSTLSLVE